MHSFCMAYIRALASPIRLDFTAHYVFFHARQLLYWPPFLVEPMTMIFRLRLFCWRVRTDKLAQR